MEANTHKHTHKHTLWSSKMVFPKLVSAVTISFSFPHLKHQTPKKNIAFIYFLLLFIIYYYYYDYLLKL